MWQVMFAHVVKLLVCVFFNMVIDVNRIWDCFLWEGIIVLHRIALAMCKIMEPDLLLVQPDDIIALYAIIRSPIHSLLSYNEMALSLQKKSIYQITRGSYLSIKQKQQVRFQRLQIIMKLLFIIRQHLIILDLKHLF